MLGAHRCVTGWGGWNRADPVWLADPKRAGAEPLPPVALPPARLCATGRGTMPRLGGGQRGGGCPAHGGAP